MRWFADFFENRQTNNIIIKIIKSTAIVTLVLNTIHFKTESMRSTYLFNNAGGNKRQHDLVVANKIKTLSTAGCRADDNIGHGPVVDDEIHIYRGEFIKVMPEVPRKSDCL